MAMLMVQFLLIHFPRPSTNSLDSKSCSKPNMCEYHIMKLEFSFCKKQEKKREEDAFLLWKQNLTTTFLFLDKKLLPTFISVYGIIFVPKFTRPNF
ncbi:hypothetical protein BpHYR1_027926 [Brachionus plicatilis]|uniref:Uncharacterized protein n=1 Tax=Brachionus plicatilis TaxID=10195 RepID=A0A3M7RZ09_BRAPC|nr:hypothetical protein BpHYR1_027926 [Brachionus plicatilis]